MMPSILHKIRCRQRGLPSARTPPAAGEAGSDKSRGYCLEMICADFLAGAHIENGDPKILLFSMLRLFRFLPSPEKQRFLSEVTKAA